MNSYKRNLLLPAAATLAVCALAVPADAAVEGFTAATFTPAPSPNISTTSIINSFTTSSGTVNTLGGTQATANISTGPSGDSFRNYWGANTTEIDGAASITTGGGLDVGHGAINLVSGDFLFGVTLNDTGAAGNANDIFFTDIGGNDATVVRPLDSSGNLIGDFQLAIAGASLTSSGTNITFTGDNVSSGGSFSNSTAALAGVAFDISDFTSTSVSGGPTGVAGIRIDGNTALDPGVVGYNLNAIPEPASLALLGLGGLTLLARRRKA